MFQLKKKSIWIFQDSVDKHNKNLFFRYKKKLRKDTTLSNLTLWNLHKNQLLWWEKRLLTTKTRDILITDYFNVSLGLCPSVISRLLLWAWYNTQRPHNGLWNIRIFIGYWKVNDKLEELEGREVRPIIIWAQGMFNEWTGMIMQATLP